MIAISRPGVDDLRRQTSAARDALLGGRTLPLGRLVAAWPSGNVTSGRTFGIAARCAGLRW